MAMRSPTRLTWSITPAAISRAPAPPAAPAPGPLLDRRVRRRALRPASRIARKPAPPKPAGISTMAKAVNSICSWAVVMAGSDPEVDHAAHDQVADEHPRPERAEPDLDRPLAQHVAVEVRPEHLQEQEGA